MVPFWGRLGRDQTELVDEFKANPQASLPPSDERFATQCVFCVCKWRCTGGILGGIGSDAFCVLLFNLEEGGILGIQGTCQQGSSDHPLVG
eukprot:6596087-Ditylum_brightwellii.AAC.1